MLGVKAGSICIYMHGISVLFVTGDPLRLAVIAVPNLVGGVNEKAIEGGSIRLFFLACRKAERITTGGVWTYATNAHTRKGGEGGKTALSEGALIFVD